MIAIISYLFPSRTYLDSAIELEKLQWREITLDQILNMEKEIESYKAEQIEVLAKKVIAAFINDFEIDIRSGMVEEKPNPELGNDHPIYHVIPTVNSNAEKLAAFLPSVQDQIKEAVCTPQSYAYKGETFSTSTEEDAQMVSEWLQAPCQEAKPRIGTAVEEVLLPSVKKRIAKAVSTPLGFISGGVYFPLFTKDRRGLLDKLDRSLHLGQFNETAGLTLSANLGSSNDIRFDIKGHICRETHLFNQGTLKEFKLHVELGIV